MKEEHSCRIQTEGNGSSSGIQAQSPEVPEEGDGRGVSAGPRVGPGLKVSREKKGLCSQNFIPSHTGTFV